MNTNLLKTLNTKLPIDQYETIILEWVKRADDAVVASNQAEDVDQISCREALSKTEPDFDGLGYNEENYEEAKELANHLLVIRYTEVRKHFAGK